MIRLDAVVVRYGRRTVVDGFTLDVSSGECVGLVGPSGCGKSTVIKVLSGQVPVSAGSVSVGDWQPSYGSPSLGLMGLVHQDPHASLDPLWSVRRTVAEPLAARRRHRSRSSQQVERSVDAALTAVRLGHVDQRVRTSSLSVGQAQRVALARALIAGPKVLLADEPTSALDPTTAATVVRLLREASDAGAATLVVSHHAVLLETFCDRVIDMAPEEIG